MSCYIFVGAWIKWVFPGNPFLSKRILISVSQSKLQPLLEATKLLIRYILNRLESNVNTPQFLTALKTICDGKLNPDNVPNVNLKYLKYPESPKTGASEDDSSKGTEMKRSRSDLSIVIMQQLIQPLSTGVISFTTLSEEETDCTVRTFFPTLKIPKWKKFKCFSHTRKST